MEQQVELESGPMDPMMMDQDGGVNQGTFDYEFFQKKCDKHDL